jgi:DNA recombination-dependent growth factor C
MGILSGALTARRYRVVGDVPDGFREIFAESLRGYSFRDKSSLGSGEELVGWVEVHNLLDAGFEDLNRWLYDRYAIFSLRVDKKVLPSKLFKAHLEKRVEAWCQEHQRSKCPAAVRGELKELLEFEMLQKTLPRVSVHEVCWNITDGWLLFHNLSERANERFIKIFFETFGLHPQPQAPLDLLGDDADLTGALLATGGLDYRPEVNS